MPRLAARWRPARSARPPGEEQPDRPFTGYKLAHAVLSADGARAGFTGLSLGAGRVYGVTADATCVWNARHAPPRRRCGCGFYCLHAEADARALSCATANRDALLLEVVASGRYIRYERGIRSSRQRVRAIVGARCACGRPAAALTDAGTGLVGWRHLAPLCGSCATARPAISLRDFAARLDARSPVTAPRSGAPPPARSPTPTQGSSAQGTPAQGSPGPGPAQGSPGPPGPPGSAPESTQGLPLPESPLPGLPLPLPLADISDIPVMWQSVPPDDSPIAVLTAEIALLHARLDDLQARLDRDS